MCTLSAPGTNSGHIDLQGLNVTFGDNLGGPWLAFDNIDPTPFYSLPEFLNPGDSLRNVLLFTATIDAWASVTSGTVKVELTAFDAAGGNVSVTTVAAAQIVPEPASVLLERIRAQRAEVAPASKTKPGKRLSSVAGR